MSQSDANSDSRSVIIDDFFIPESLKIEKALHSYAAERGALSKEEIQTISPLLLDLQKCWLGEYEKMRTEVLAQMVPALHKQLSNQLGAATQALCKKFNDECEQMRFDESRIREREIEAHLNEVKQRNKLEIQQAKKSQWCNRCMQEARYFCCWNCSYCSVVCQHEDWPIHREVCRRQKDPTE